MAHQAWLLLLVVMAAVTQAQYFSGFRSGFPAIVPSGYHASLGHPSFYQYTDQMVAVPVASPAAPAAGGSTAKLPCPAEGFFPHPSDCSKFYRCVDFAATGQFFSRYEFQCPAGHVFVTVGKDTCVPGDCPGSAPASGVATAGGAYPGASPAVGSSDSQPPSSASVDQVSSFPAQGGGAYPQPGGVGNVAISSQPVGVGVTQPVSSEAVSIPAVTGTEYPQPAVGEGTSGTGIPPQSSGSPYPQPAPVVADMNTQPSVAGGAYPQPGAVGTGAGASYPQAGSSSSGAAAGSAYPQPGAAGTGAGTSYPQPGSSNLGAAAGSAYPQPGAAGTGAGASYPQPGSSSSGAAAGSAYPQPGASDVPQPGVSYPQQASESTVGCPRRYVQAPDFCNIYESCPSDGKRYVCTAGSVFDQNRQMCRLPDLEDVCKGKPIYNEGARTGVLPILQHLTPFMSSQQPFFYTHPRLLSYRQPLYTSGATLHYY